MQGGAVMRAEGTTLMTGRWHIIVALLVLPILTATAARTSAEEIKPGSKLCSAVTPDNWRDTINVPDGWVADDCRKFMQSVAANTFFVGCLDDAGVRFGAAGGAAPSPNCNW